MDLARGTPRGPAATARRPHRCCGVCQGLQVLERASRGVEDIPEGGDDFRRLGILDDLATEHEAVNGGTWLADPGPPCRRGRRVSHPPNDKTVIDAYSVTSVSLGGEIFAMSAHMQRRLLPDCEGLRRAHPRVSGLTRFASRPTDVTPGPTCDLARARPAGRRVTAVLAATSGRHTDFLLKYL